MVRVLCFVRVDVDVDLFVDVVCFDLLLDVVVFKEVEVVFFLVVLVLLVVVLVDFFFVEVVDLCFTGELHFFN